ncbi:MAG TPA: sulfur carrier protein ThiS [Vicinamibacterales bacterium]|nr:sulfur carrier protein ThiS [Vicinamibacterales bacterium]
MRITLNGEAADVPPALTVQTLLQHLRIDPRVVAVERNRVVVKRAEYGETTLAEGDEIEIVAFVGGG